MDDVSRGQVSKTAAEVYDEFFVPALFAPWAGEMVRVAGLAPGQSVLDVACGTGVVAREAARKVSPGGSVVGLDRNPGMLEVARRHDPGIEWREGRAEELPFGDGRFDAVLCQFGLMFFEDGAVALREMWRVLTPGGRLVVAVWDAIETSPGYAAMVDLLQRLFGDRAANALRAPFVLGDRSALGRLLAQADVAAPEIVTSCGTARFPTLESWMYTDIRGWTLADMIDDGQYQTLLREAKTELARFVQGDGTVSFDAPAHLAIATKA